jgi:phosphinothricin acetyltransferase
MNVTMRLATDADCDAIAAIYAPYVFNTAISFENEPPDAEEMRRRVGETLKFLPWLVCSFDGRVVGYAYADRFRTRAAYQWSSSVSVYVDSELHRSGVGRGLYTSLFRILELQGFFNLFAGITLPNQPSVGLHRSFGFEQIAVERSVGYKLGRWHDVSMWQKLLRQHHYNPEPVKPLQTIAESQVWGPAISAGLSFVDRRR